MSAGGFIQALRAILKKAGFKKSYGIELLTNNMFSYNDYVL